MLHRRRYSEERRLEVGCSPSFLSVIKAVVRVIGKRVDAHLTGAWLVRTIVEHQVQTLKKHNHQLYRYLEQGDPTREGSEDLPAEEVTQRMTEVLVGEVTISTVGCPKVFTALEPPNLASFPVFCCQRLSSSLFVCLEQSLLRRGSSGSRIARSAFPKATRAAPLARPNSWRRCRKGGIKGPVGQAATSGPRSVEHGASHRTRRIIQPMAAATAMPLHSTISLMISFAMSIRKSRRSLRTFWRGQRTTGMPPLRGAVAAPPHPGDPEAQL